MCVVLNLVMLSASLYILSAANFSVLQILSIRVCAFVRVYLHRSIEQVEQVMETEGMYLTAVQLSKHAGSWVMESISHTHKHLHASAHKHANSYWVMKFIKLALLLAHTYSLKIKCSSRAPKCTSTSLNLESWC